MSLDTLIASSWGTPPVPSPNLRALVLMGGGARTAYQAGVLHGLARLLARQGHPPSLFPFQILLGTSAGALNAAYLASQSTLGLPAFEHLSGFWHRLRSTQVYNLPALHWLPANLLVAGWALARQIRHHRALLDTMPLVDTLHRTIHLRGIEQALEQRAIDALAITASSYTTGEHWTFCQTHPHSPLEPWHRPGRRASLQPITIEHLMASSAIPFLFPAVPLWVNGQKAFFGDGSMRQLTPLSPAIQLGAQKILVISVGQPDPTEVVNRRHGVDSPTAGTIAGHAMASVFHDTLMADVEQAQRVSQTLASLPTEIAQALPYRAIEVLAIKPTQSLDQLALKHLEALPRATRHTLAGIGAFSTTQGSPSNAAALASYLMFEPPFVNALMEWGEADAWAQKEALLTFFDTVSS